ncbi:geranylgeranyl reductase family protein [Nakamurella leprariae]|uniref:Geranylgeranyl reductase family protein n=1 Tax=Nakamurella leprariae TaxID=2803911 RepID=A0A938YD44_9ACTN|nr:geranylgeranyl reductase family protein [Nakamurella leprariae]
MAGLTGDLDTEADVIVVGAGPAGSTAATLLARSGLDVLLLEKSTFPRDKVCGDGITPRGVKQVLALGIDVSGPDWIKNRGLRVVGGGRSIELPWPTLQDYPDFGLVRPRRDFDDLLATLAVKAGARLHTATTVTGPVVDDRTGRVVGVEATVRDTPDESDFVGAADARPVKAGRRTLTFRAPVVIAADGVSARVALGLGIAKRDDRPLGVAVRRYYESPRTNDDFLESHLELWDRSDAADPKLLPGYGWIFGLGDGTVNVGLGMLNSSSAFGRTDYRALLRTWLDGTPPEWGLRGEEHAIGPINGAALPMGFNRTPHYRDGLLLVGDAGGAVNPFNGEGIAYAMESAAMAADAVLQALGRPDGPSREAALHGYVAAMKQHLGSYYRLGGIFSSLIGHPKIMATATRLGLPRKHLMYLVLKLLAGLHDSRDGDWADRVVRGLTKVAPSV